MSQLDDLCEDLECKVFDYDKVGSNDLMGAYSIAVSELRDERASQQDGNVRLCARIWVCMKREPAWGAHARIFVEARNSASRASYLTHVARRRLAERPRTSIQL